MSTGAHLPTHVVGKDGRSYSATRGAQHTETDGKRRLRLRIEQAITDRIDREAWQRAEVTEAAEVESLATILSAWTCISGQASK